MNNDTGRGREYMAIFTSLVINNAGHLVHGFLIILSLILNVVSVCALDYVIKIPTLATIECIYEMLFMKGIPGCILRLAKGCTDSMTLSCKRFIKLYEYLSAFDGSYMYSKSQTKSSAAFHTLNMPKRLIRD